MFKKVLSLFLMMTSAISLTSCSFESDNSSNYFYVSSYFDDDTEGNAFLINRVQDLNTIIYSDKTDRTELEQFDNGYFENNSLIVFKIINNSNNVRRIKKFTINGKNINITIPKQLTSSKQKYYFYIAKTKKILTESLEWINIYEGTQLLNKTRVQEEEFYDFLSNFDLNNPKRPLFGINELYLDPYFIVSLKNTSNPYKKAKIEYFGIDSIVTINYLFDVNDGSFNGVEVNFKEHTRESIYEIAKKLQKVEFIRKVLSGVTVPT